MSAQPKRRPPLVWAQSRYGRAIDLLNPHPADINFAEMAETLAHIPRFNACTRVPISVAQHLLIAADAAPKELRPWVLLHDAHEAVLGDIITPVVAALDHLVHGMHVSAALASLKTRHDEAIHAAAGLEMPRHIQRREIREADLRALVTERRDFLAKAPFSWGAEIENVAPLTKRYVAMDWDEAASALMDAWLQHLPVLQPKEQTDVA